MGVELAITLVGVGLTMGGSFGSAASTAKQTRCRKWPTLPLRRRTSPVASCRWGSGATDVAGSVYDYKISTSYADTKELEAILERIQQAQDMGLIF